MSKKKAEKTEIIDVSEHVMVPRHILLSKEEAREVLERYKIKPYQLPYVKSSDPAIRHLKVTAGDVIKILRRSSTSGEAVAYRYVIEE